MPPAAAIRKYGFRRWYSRQLVEGHAHLVTGFLALIMMAIAIEEIEFRHTLAGWLSLLAVATAGGALCLFAWKQFSRVLFRAEHLAEHATCERCRAYARFDIEATRDHPDAVAGCLLDVRCRGCGHGRTIM